MAMNMPMSMDSDMEFSTSPECYATDSNFLQTLAWCISTHCDGTAAATLEKYWAANVAGTAPENQQPEPKMSYQQALANVLSPPIVVVQSDDPINQTSLVAEEDYIGNFNGQGAFEAMETIQEGYASVLIPKEFQRTPANITSA